MEQREQSQARLSYAESRQRKAKLEATDEEAKIDYIATVGVLMAIPLIGMPFVYEGLRVGEQGSGMQTMTGHVLALLTGIGGLGAGDYHLPMHFLKKSEVCKNTLLYWLMALLTLASVALVIVTILRM